MSETVAVALITGGLTGAFGLAGAILAHQSAKHQGLVNLSVANQTAQIELEKITAENARLREQRREDKRERRQDAYHQLLDVGTKLYRLFGSKADLSESEALVEEYNRLIAGLLLFAPDTVRDQAYGLNDIVRKTWEDIGEQDASLPDTEKWKSASEPHQEEMGEAINGLVDVMREDVVRFEEDV